MRIETIFLFTNLFCGMSYSVFPPLFPKIKSKNEISQFLIGLIIGIFALSYTFTTALFPSLNKKFSPLMLFNISIISEAICTLLYGFFGSLNLPLIILIIILRIIHGFCCGIKRNLVNWLTISISQKENSEISLEYLEVGWYMGTLFGPLVSSIFYKLGGYSLPFIFLGLLIYISKCLISNLEQEDIEIEEDFGINPTYLKYLLYSDNKIILGSLLLGIIAQTFYYPSLTIHLKQVFNLPITISCLFFIISSATYLISTQFINMIRKQIGLYSFSILGFSMLALGIIMIYPFPPIPPSILFIIMGLALIGIGNSFILIPCLILLNNNIKRINSNIDIFTLYEITSSINNLTFGIGSFLGPLIDGFLITYFRFEYYCLILCIIICIFCIIFFTKFDKFILDKENSLIDEESNIITDKEKEFSNSNIFINKDIDSSLLSNKFGKKYSFSIIKKDNEELIEYQYFSLSDEEDLINSNEN